MSEAIAEIAAATAKSKATSALTPAARAYLREVTKARAIMKTDAYKAKAEAAKRTAADKKAAVARAKIERQKAAAANREPGAERRGLAAGRRTPARGKIMKALIPTQVSQSPQEAAVRALLTKASVRP